MFVVDKNDARIHPECVTGEPKRPQGRPKKDDARGRAVQFRMLDSLGPELDRLASELGLSPGQCARDMVEKALLEIANRRRAKSR
jgi:hypothetical protein